MDGPTTIPSSLSVSSLQRDIARRISGNYWDSAEIQNSSQSSCGNTKTAQQLSLPAQHLANPRAPISPQMATSADDEACHCIAHRRPRTQQLIFDVGKISLTANQPAEKGYGPPDKIIGRPPVKRERGVMPAMDKIQRAPGEHSDVKLELKGCRGQRR